MVVECLRPKTERILGWVAEPKAILTIEWE